MNITPARLQNLLVYVLVCLANMLAIAVAAALAAGTMPGFRDGELLAPARAEMAALLAFAIPILSAWVAANRPSFGGEGLAAQASVYREQGIHRDDMVVLPRDQAAIALAGNGAVEAALTPTQVQQIVAALKAELIRDPEGDDPVPVSQEERG